MAIGRSNSNFPEHSKDFYRTGDAANSQVLAKETFLFIKWGKNVRKIET